MYLSILRQYWGYDSFRGIQQQIIESIGSGHDTLGLMPTGGGKSITFQVPALALPGTCLVITPLIALMKDQVMGLRQRGIKATAIHAGMSHDEILVALDNCILGDYKFLYISPERIGTELFQRKLSHIQVSFITIDEAHCISQWGHDFRPSYLHIHRLRRWLPAVPILALTATATPQVMQDITQVLQFREGRTYRMSFHRPNLSYVVRKTGDKNNELIHILEHVPGSAIVYCRNRAATRFLATTLCQYGIPATYYHAGLPYGQRDTQQRLWQDGKVRVIVATNAFGMGIDKPDVRLVIHMDLPDSPEAYFQEAGRAGRDGKGAYAILLFEPKADTFSLNRHLSSQFPSPESILTVYDRICFYFQLGVGCGKGHTYNFDLADFCHGYHYFPVLVESALRLLTLAGYIRYEAEPDRPSRLRFIISRDDLYHTETGDPFLDTLIAAILRSYSGVFADFVTIDETALRQMLHQYEKTDDLIYQGLKTLSRRRIIDYIPRRNTPTIQFTQARVEHDQLYLAPEVYSQRKADYHQRTQAMLHYAQSEGQCRSQILLEYFGEYDSPRCGRCDTCRQQQPTPTPHDTHRQLLLHALSDGKAHTIPQLQALPIPHKLLEPLLEELIASGQLTLTDNLQVRLSETTPSHVDSEKGGPL